MIPISKLKKILSGFKKLTIAVIGDIMLDEYLIGKVARISPEAPVPVVNITKERLSLGGAANVIKNIVTLGARTYAYGIVGDDENGKKLKKELTSKYIDSEGVIVDIERPTIVKSRVIAQGQQLIRLDREKDLHISENNTKQILEKFRKNIKKIDAVILSDYNKGVLTEELAKAIISLCREYNIIVTADPKPHNFKNYTGASSITPNMKEVKEFLGIAKFKNEDDLTEKLNDIKNSLNLETLLLTRSEEGVSLFEKEHERVETLAQEVYDVTGAGDTLISAFTLARASGATWLEAAETGNLAAGIVVGKLGTAVTTPKEILEFNRRFL